MGQISLLTPVLGQSDSTEETKVVSNFRTIETVINGEIDTSNLAAAAGVTAAQLARAVNEAAALNNGSSVRRGKTIIATEESRTNTAYGTLTTPDVVRSVVLPTDGLIAVAYHATWAESVQDAASAAIFIGANQLKIAQAGSAVPVVQGAGHGNTATQHQPLYTVEGGLSGATATAGFADVTTGQALGQSLVGGPCYVFAAAGTYDISIKFKATSGSVTALNRRLWVWALGF
jgi:hypothetical protein